MKGLRPALGPVAVVVLFLAGMRWSPFEPHRPPADPSGAPGGTVSWADEDWAVLESTVRAAAEAGLAERTMGEAMAGIGRSLVGVPYAPATLEVEGPERLVINLRALDCVTFVENVFALATLLKAGGADRLADRAGLESEYERILAGLRYRNGRLDGYGSRLHYFSEWISDNQQKRLLTDLTRSLGGALDREPIDFMSTHADAYRQLADAEALEQIIAIESRLSAAGRWSIPQERIAEVSSQIRDGDIIAATSTVLGLDVAHTGLALWVDGTLRLLHAPLVGEAVQISEVSLAERIARIDGQDGIMVARPSEPMVTGPSDESGG